MVVARNAVNFNPSKQSRDGMNQSQFSEMAASGHSATAMDPKSGTVGGSGVLNSIESHSRQGIDLFKASDIRIPGINDSRLANKDSRPANKTLLYGNSVMSSQSPPVRGRGLSGNMLVNGHSAQLSPS